MKGFWSLWQIWGEEIFASENWKLLMEKVEQEYAQPFCFPPKHLIFNAFDHCSPHHVRCIIIGQDPYHGAGEAHGLAFSVPLGVKAPPSLRNIFKELYNDLGETRLLSDLTDWAQQGVLLINTHLTVRENQSLSHQHLGWEWFTNQIIKKLIAQNSEIILVLWGNEAKKKKLVFQDFSNPIIESSHPSPLGAHRGFLGSKPFSKINKIIEAQGKAPIRWS